MFTIICFITNYDVCFQGDAKEQKTEENKKKKKKSDSEEDKEDQESLDWWSKYFASVETMIKVRTS